MLEQEIYEKLTGIFRDIFDDENIVLTSQTKADDIEDWDSANHIILIVAIEAAFGVKFKSAEIEELHNVGDIVALIQRNLA